MTGWRIATPAPTTKVMANYVSHSPVLRWPSPEGRRCGLSGSQAEIETMRQAFEQRRSYDQWMNAIPA